MNAITPTIADDPSRDKIGAFASDFDTDALPVRRSASLARMMTIMCGVSMCGNIAMALALAALMPLQKVVPMVVTAGAKEDQIIHVNPITLDSPTSDYLTEVALRDYVTKRYTILSSAAAQENYWGAGSAVHLMSTPEIFEEFMRKAKPDFDRLMAQQMVRTVRLGSATKIGDNVWQIQFNTTEEPSSGPFAAAASGQTQSWIATFEVTFESKNIRYEDRLVNPLGLTITSASEARRD